MDILTPILLRRLKIFDSVTSKTLFKEYLPLSLANDTRVTNLYFMGNLILFPTLNGKVIIVSLLNNESVKNISVDPDNEFNNIISLNVIESTQTLIVASPNKMNLLVLQNAINLVNLMII